MADLNKREADRIEGILKRDVSWILFERKMGFNPQRGCIFDGGTKKFKLKAGECGTCLVGAHMMHHQPEQSRVAIAQGYGVKDYVAFAQDVNIDKEAAYAIYIGATLETDVIAKHPRACLVAAHVLEFALSEEWVPKFTDLDGYKQRLNRYIGTCERLLS